MKVLLTAILLLINICCFSQTVAELEHELSFYKSGETWGNKKELAIKLLEIDGLNSKAINYLVRAYGQNHQKDSIQMLFDKIIKENPNRPEPYIIRVSNGNPTFEGLTDTQQISFLKKALDIDRTNSDATYKLGKMYYDLFVKEYRAGKNKSNLESYATSSLLHFDALCEQKDSCKETLKYPMLQLANYLGDANKIKLYEQYNVQTSHFPISELMDLPVDWKTNYTVNVIDYVSGVMIANFRLDWYSKQLIALKEPILNDSSPTKVFRFTWLRSFHNPIAIRLENKKDQITVYWKVCDGKGGYEPGKLVTDKKKKLSLKEWTQFQQKIDSIDFWNIPTTDNSILGLDGARWILEGKEFGKYHVEDKWSGGNLKPICLDLLKMTDLEIKEGDKY